MLLLSIPFRLHPVPLSLRSYDSEAAKGRGQEIQGSAENFVPKQVIGPQGSKQQRYKNRGSSAFFLVQSTESAFVT
jgi:hypothetical protein